MSAAKTVLVVDDDEALRGVIIRFLERRGYRAMPAANGAEALDIIRKGEKIDLVILDVMMPGRSGFEVLEEIRGLNIGQLPVVMLTALDRDESVMEGYQVGADYYITKPFQPSSLLNIVDYLIGDLTSEERANLERLI